jgi:hypothetical protein
LMAATRSRPTPYIYGNRLQASLTGTD